MRFDGNGSIARPRPRPEFRKVVALWIPHRYFIGAAIDIGAFLADINDKIRRRGVVLLNGQLLTTAIEDIDSQVGVISLSGDHVKGHQFQGCIKLGERSELIHEKNSGDGIFQVAAYRDWSAPQRDYFGLPSPYQMAEEPDSYSWSHIATSIVEPYLTPEEQIVGVVHGIADDYYYYCPCHCAEVVYTTRHRLVCMGCGAIHVVLREPLGLTAKRLLTAHEWLQYFDDSGANRDQEIDLTTVDFRDVENAATIWSTDQWDEAKHRFIFFARSSPEVIAEAIRGTEADPSILLEAGWHPLETALPPAHQVASDSIDVDLLENAAHSVAEGVASFLGARNDSSRLINAVSQLFRAVELLLKAKLFSLRPQLLRDKPNNPTVMDRLVELGVSIKESERKEIDRLRGLRNDLQHGAAKFSHRTGLAVSKNCIVFFDRFSREELDRWIGDVLPADDLFEINRIAEIGSAARGIVARRIDDMRRNPEAEISVCQRCGEEANVRPHPHTGASCLLCGYVHVQQEDGSGQDEA